MITICVHVRAHMYLLVHVEDTRGPTLSYPFRYRLCFNLLASKSKQFLSLAPRALWLRAFTQLPLAFDIGAGYSNSGHHAC